MKIKIPEQKEIEAEDLTKGWYVANFNLTDTPEKRLILVCDKEDGVRKTYVFQPNSNHIQRPSLTSAFDLYTNWRKVKEVTMKVEF